MISSNLEIASNGHLLFAGQDCERLALQYGTPLYLLDEDRLRENMRIYQQSMDRLFFGKAKVLYASKANTFKQIYRILQQEKLGAEVVSSGEIYTAQQAGFDLSQVFFHGSNKTNEEIRYALQAGVGCFVVDNPEELLSLEHYAEEQNRRQKILLRITPGIDPHTYKEVNTGQIDSKFGQAIGTGQAQEFIRLALAQPFLHLCGFHCHVGSQVFTEDVFERSAVVMLHFIHDMHQIFGYQTEMLDLGGGYGVRYVETDPTIDLPGKLRDLAETVFRTCSELGDPVPQILLEPGRSIVADAGLTLYTIGFVKTIPGIKNYVSVDGGMTDNPRFALYGSAYTVYPANRMLEPFSRIYSLVGRCCENDLIQESVSLPESLTRGDLLAVCTTGAYNYSMASNYNRIPRPPVVMLRGGESYIAVRRETLANLVALDE